MGNRDLQNLSRNKRQAMKTGHGWSGFHRAGSVCVCVCVCVSVYGVYEGGIYPLRILVMYKHLRQPYKELKKHNKCNSTTTQASVAAIYSNYPKQHCDL